MKGDQHYLITFGGIDDQTFGIDEYDKASEEFKRICRESPGVSVELSRVTKTLLASY